MIEGGVLIALLYALTRSLWLVIGYHAAWNIMQGPVLGVPISGTGEGPSLVSTVAHGSEWLTGGAFGTEASLVTVTVATLVNIVLVIVLIRSRRIVEPRWTRHAVHADARRPGQ